jgi:hypothetical protein
MNKAFALGFLALSSSAFAQDLVVHPSWMLEPVPGKIYETGIGSPAVAYDRTNDLWTMFFETQFGPPDAECGFGRWGIGRATSPDGLSWTIDDDLVVSPTPGTYYDMLPERIDKLGIEAIDEQISELRELEILVDGNAKRNYMLQIFMRELSGIHDDPECGPFFFEIIQRKGDQGFGAGNFRALFESIERQQVAAGVIG